MGGERVIGEAVLEFAWSSRVPGRHGTKPVQEGILGRGNSIDNSLGANTCSSARIRDRVQGGGMQEMTLEKGGRAQMMAVLVVRLRNLGFTHWLDRQRWWAGAARTAWHC